MAIRPVQLRETPWGGALQCKRYMKVVQAWAARQACKEKSARRAARSLVAKLCPAPFSELDGVDGVDGPTLTASECQGVAAGAPQKREAVREGVYQNWR